MTETSNNTAELNKPSADWLTPEMVKDYLLSSPEFFARYPLLSEQLRIPHQKKGSVSLVELQAEQLRDKVSELQTKLTELMSVARQNETIYRIYADLHLKLFHCRSLADIRQALTDTFSDELQLSGVALHLFEDSAESPYQGLLDKRLNNKLFFFGRLNLDENQLLFAQKQPRSVVLMRLKHQQEIGLLAIGSDDEGHFNPDMDTLLITQLQQFLSLLLPGLQD